LENWGKTKRKFRKHEQETENLKGNQKCRSQAGLQWLTLVILATQMTEIRRIVVQSQPGQIIHETLSRKKPFTKKGWWSGSMCRSCVQAPAPKKKKRVRQNWQNWQWRQDSGSAWVWGTDKRLKRSGES
jgi:hypothetical protein